MDLITPFFNFVIAPTTTYSHMSGIYDPKKFKNDKLESFSFNSGISRDLDSGKRQIVSRIRLAEMWASLWAFQTPKSIQVPLSWALEQDFVESGTRFIKDRYGICPVVNGETPRIFHGKAKDNTVPTADSGKNVAYWYDDSVTSASLPLALGDLTAMCSWETEEWRQSLLELLHSRQFRNN